MLPSVSWLNRLRTLPPGTLSKSVVFFTVSLLATLTTGCQSDRWTTGQDISVDSGVVVSVEQYASETGGHILRNGGNAVDAAVATALALAVTWPPAGNLGGGGFMVLSLADGTETTIDYREMAPAGATPDMFLTSDGVVDRERVRLGRWPVGVPGTVRGLQMALERYGTMSFAEVVQPAIILARRGFIVSNALADFLATHADELAKFETSRAIFFREDGKTWQAGDRLVQNDLAESLGALAKEGPDAFYEGSIAKKIVADMEKHHGLITADDLRGYHAIEREPIRFRYQGCDVLAMPPPSSGGIALGQFLGMLEPFDMAAILRNDEGRFYHLVGEALRRAFADRARYLGDADFVDVPIEKLLSAEHIEALRESIGDQASSSEAFGPPLQEPAEAMNTTHFSVVDKWGNAVANTYTLEESFGAKVVAEGTGILLNNEMHDFNVMPGVTSSKGRIGTDPNLVAPRKRPLSSMTPTIVKRDGKPFVVTGSPGGRTIISTVAQMVLRIVGCGMDPLDAQNAPRVHHQWYPDELRVERSLSPALIQSLQERGHRVTTRKRQGDAHTIVVDENGDVRAIADPRIWGWAASS